MVQRSLEEFHAWALKKRLRVGLPDYDRDHTKRLGFQVKNIQGARNQVHVMFRFREDSWVRPFPGNTLMLHLVKKGHDPQAVRLQRARTDKLGWFAMVMTITPGSAPYKVAGDPLLVPTRSQSYRDRHMRRFTAQRSGRYRHRWGC